MKKVILTIITILACLTSNMALSAGKEKDTVSQAMVVLDKLASELLESLNIRSKIAIRPFYKKETGLSDSLNSSLINALVSSLQRKSNYKINLIARDKLKKVWQEVDEFKSTDFNKLVKEAGADVLIIGDVRTRKQGLELSFRAYDTADSAKKGEVGKILASTRLRYLKMDWQNEAGFSPESTKKSLNLITDTLKTIQKSFDIISKSGGLIQNPTRPEQFYHNARVQEQGGDYGNARRSYNRYFGFKLEFLDPHLRYQTFLKIQEGRAGAREIYSAIYERDPRPVVEFVKILLFNAPKRTKMLKDFITKNPDFAPAYYELSREYSAVRKGTQSLTDKKAELKALKEFDALRKGGKFLKFFVDKELASKWIADSVKRVKALSLVADMKEKSPLSISAGKSNSGWSVRAEISEGVREIFYKLPGMKKFKSLGHSQYKNPTTGLFRPNQEFPLSCPPGKKRYSLRCDLVNTKIKYKYIDMTKTERGPFTILFDGKKELDVFCRRLLELSFGNDIKKVHRYPGCEYFSR
ncbi:hypothetical protein N9452_07925 [Alphaproteobacteria bacterium]|nr:hypothetical protein [Alphaproteobacteria bacterium]